ncbi:MAG: STAS domain-containing protein [Magnetococcales bacterium]|nr:STAS domain-containing protein [Magnetococcales bacterium]
MSETTFQVSETADSVKISISGNKFKDFDVKRFRECFQERPEGTKYTLDFANLRFADSSFLGGLLYLLAHNDSQNDPTLIEIINCSEQVKSSLDMIMFDKFFTFR